MNWTSFSFFHQTNTWTWTFAISIRIRECTHKTNRWLCVCIEKAFHINNYCPYYIIRFVYSQHIKSERTMLLFTDTLFIHLNWMDAWFFFLSTQNWLRSITTITFYTRRRHRENERPIFFLEYKIIIYVCAIKLLSIQL